MFDVDYDPHENFLTISVRGHMTPADAGALAKAVDATARAAVGHSEAFDVIVESLEFPVQAQDVAGLLTGIMTSGMALTTGRTAVVVSSQLSKMQAERTLVHPRVRVFLSLDAAQAWLHGEGAAP